jgi:hypothetical protein
MTPARRAALKKAQAASARKRRRGEIAGMVGRGTIAIGGAFAAARISSYIARPGKISKDYNRVKNFITRKKSVPEQSALPKALKNSRMTWIP